ncbi:MAG: periplasmic heavy metal sensor [Gammaproteobacteria bacterium]|nr:periplasmic heavy metal sensor [Gammaproteobacteria bacterium]
MNTGFRRVGWIIALMFVVGGASAYAQQSGISKDVFKGKLFAPDIVLEHQDALGLTKAQFTAIRAAVVKVQSNVAEHEWDLRMAYRDVLRELDRSPVDSGRVLELVDTALEAENKVKKLQVAMLIELRNLLTNEQMDYLREVNGY